MVYLCCTEVQMTYFVRYINRKKQKETIEASEQGQMNIKDSTDCKHNLNPLTNVFRWLFKLKAFTSGSTFPIGYNVFFFWGG